MARLGLVLALTATATATASIGQLLVNRDPLTVAEDEFDWAAVRPSKDLVYHQCYGSFKCARLEVPLDWLNESDPRTAVIAIRTAPAQVPDDSPLFGGSVLTNPGGPGGSGVEFVGLAGEVLQKYLDKPGRRHYEIVSFDPRGIGYTTPAADCFHGDILARDSMIIETQANGPLHFGGRALSYGLALMGSYSAKCKQSEEEWGESMPYVNTPSVARDMVAIIDKIDELRQREAAERDGRAKDEGDSPHELKKRSENDLPRLQYIGYSYGTVLGNYFASLFPGRVGRLVLDGVCDTDDYANGPGWTTNLVDTDEIFDQFWEGCAKAGEDKCSLVNGTGDDAVSESKTRFWTWIKALDESPVVAKDSNQKDVIVTGQDILLFIGMLLYFPRPGFPIVAAIVDQGMNGESLGFVADIVSGMVPALPDACPVGNVTVLPRARQETQQAVLCGDGDDITDKDHAWWSRYVQKQVDTSKVLGTLWSRIRFACSSWPFTANWSFKGPFTTPKADPSLQPETPAAPLLFLSNKLDPVTPLSAARRMAAQHPGAGIVVQESMGHCTLFSAPSNCTRKIVSDYFESGDVPLEETVCEASCGPWDDDCSSGGDDLASLFSSSGGHHGGRIPVRKFPLGVL